MTTGSMFLFAIANTVKACVLFAARAKRYNMKRHYDSKHYIHFDSAYPGKGEHLNEFNTRFDVYVSEAKRGSLFAQCTSHLNEASYRTYHFLVQN